jgi:hypothetical protein
LGDFTAQADQNLLEPLMTREGYLMAQAFVVAIEVLSVQPDVFRQDNNIREMKGCLDRLAVPSNLIAHLQSQARTQIDRLTRNGS